MHQSLHDFNIKLKGLDMGHLDGTRYISYNVYKITTNLNDLDVPCMHHKV